MNKQFIPYELSIIAKNKGFNKQTFACYNRGKVEFFDKNQYITNSDICSPFISAPTHQQISDWIRQEHKIQINVFPYAKQGKQQWQFELVRLVINNWNNGESYNPYIISAISDAYLFNDYYEAYNKAIEVALDKIQ